jgi:uncharacterized protein (TIGR01319 family)
MNPLPENAATVLVTDCGSTTTKALLFERTEHGWRQTYRGEAPTTVEEPVADVTVGVSNACREIQEISGRQLLDDSGALIIGAGNAATGVDLYLSTSSAGGGLQMLVVGVVGTISTESAQRAALGAGAIVMDAVSADDGREDYERIERIRHVKPDIVLLTGGIDGGSASHVVEMAEILVAADPKARFGDTLRLPVIYAGNTNAATEVGEILGRMAEVVVVKNVRPTLDRENITPAREAIHELFLSHVMSHSPGYRKLLAMSPVPVMPTPAAVGAVVNAYANESEKSVLCADIGGATTDIFSVFPDAQGKKVGNRSVSANLGMSYSMANVLVEAGIRNIMRWLPFSIGEGDLRDRLRNKMIRPTSIPQTMEDLVVEQAVCREALRLALAHHKSLAIGIGDGGSTKGIANIFRQSSSRFELVDMMHLDVVIGSGGVLSHAPNRMQAAQMMLDGFALEGITEIAVDSIFMLPHLGVFSTVNAGGAHEIFTRDCLIPLGVAVAPVFSERLPRGTEIAEVLWNDSYSGVLRVGEVSMVGFAGGEVRDGRLEVVPSHPSVDIGAGRGKQVVKNVRVGACGLILDGRNRPMMEDTFTVDAQRHILQSLGLYNDEMVR